MRIENENATLRVSELDELNDASADTLIEKVCAAVPSELRVVELDLSDLPAIDSDGVSVLMALRTAVQRTGCAPTWRLLNPAPAVRQLLELVRAHRVFEILPPRTAAVAV